MKAIVRYRYGSPDALALEEVEKPTTGDDEVLVKVHAASVNPLDWHYMRGTPLFMRFTAGGFPNPKNHILGADLAGTIEAVGKNVSRFQPGDEVFGDVAEYGLGTLAEYVCVPERAPLVPKPAGVSFEEAAAVPVAAITALQGLRDSGGVQAGQSVLVNGASGGVGTFAVQIAKALGAEVTAVCSTRNLDMVRSLGADEVVDYTLEDFTRQGQAYDLLIDAVGNCSVGDCKRVLNRNGSAVVIGFTTVPMLLQIAFLGGWASMTGSKKIGLMLAKTNSEDLIFLKGLMEEGKVSSVIDRSYALSDAAEAIRYLETARARGKVVIVV